MKIAWTFSESPATHRCQDRRVIILGVKSIEVVSPLPQDTFDIALGANVVGGRHAEIGEAVLLPLKRPKIKRRFRMSSLLYVSMEQNTYMEHKTRTYSICTIFLTSIESAHRLLFYGLYRFRCLLYFEILRCPLACSEYTQINYRKSPLAEVATAHHSVEPQERDRQLSVNTNTPNNEPEETNNQLALHQPH